MRLLLKPTEKDQPAIEVPTQGEDEAQLRNWVMAQLLKTQPVPLLVGRLADSLQVLPSHVVVQELPPQLVMDRMDAYLAFVDAVFMPLLDAYLPPAGLFRVLVEDQ